MDDLSYSLPDERGHFGPYGGVFVAETLIHALDELREQYARYRTDPEFIAIGQGHGRRRNPLAAHVRPVLAVEILDGRVVLQHADARVTTGDRR